MIDTVKYQLERAEEALRTALQLGAATEDPYLLRNIAETINTVKGWGASYRYNLTKETTSDSIKFNFNTTDSMDYSPYYVGSHVKGGMGEDVISFGSATTTVTGGDTVLTF